ncbi:unnamed protein product, partial [Porites evermanni]
ALFVAVLSFTSFMGTIVIMGPTLILLWLRPSWFRWINDRLMVIWLTLPPCLSGTRNLPFGLFSLKWLQISLGSFSKKIC